MSKEFRIIKNEFRAGSADCTKCEHSRLAPAGKGREDSTGFTICTAVVRRLELERYVSPGEPIHPKGAFYFRDAAIAPDPVTGDLIILSVNSLATTQEAHPHCIDINPDGNCRWYTPKARIDGYTPLT